jgi:23S rRNA (adenine2030-N6)-methyltransferase
MGRAWISAVNYRHAYHAGNHADALKHAVLVALLQRLAAKPTPFAVLDTHAGIGCYDLEAEAAARTGEWRDGIGRLAAARPPALADYLTAVDAVAPAYPGSPELMRNALREADRLFLCELHPEDAATLKRRYAGDARVAVHRRDGYEAIGALLPPKGSDSRPIGRGLVLIDPPYERTDEADAVARALATLVARWPHAQMALWYPIKDRALSWRLHEAALAAGYDAPLAIELTVAPEDGRTMVGSGVLLGNPPWQFAEAFAPALDALHASLDRGGGHARVAHLARA